MDSDGNVYVIGVTASLDFQTMGPLQAPKPLLGVGGPMHAPGSTRKSKSAVPKDHGEMESQFSEV